MLIREWMTSRPTAVSAGTPVLAAQDLMQAKRIRHLPVVDDERLVGIITDRDIRTVLPSPATSLAAAEILFLLDKLTVGEVMTRTVLTARPDDTLDRAVRLMLENKIGALPVTERERLVGIITETDLLRALASMLIESEDAAHVLVPPSGRKILVPLDGSAGSETVLSTIAGLARAERASVRLLHVAPPPEVVISDNRVVAYADQETARAEIEGRLYLKRASASLRGVDVDFSVRFGEPVEEIVSEAESSEVSLVAMATHRRRGLNRVVKGSVAERVERATAIPVMLVQYGEAA